MHRGHNSLIILRSFDLGKLVECQFDEYIGTPLPPPRPTNQLKCRATKECGSRCKLAESDFFFRKNLAVLMGIYTMPLKIAGFIVLESFTSWLEKMLKILRVYVNFFFFFLKIAPGQKFLSLRRECTYLECSQKLRVKCSPFSVAKFCMACLAL